MGHTASADALAKMKFLSLKGFKFRSSGTLWQTSDSMTYDPIQPSQTTASVKYQIKTPTKCTLLMYFYFAPTCAAGLGHLQGASVTEYLSLKMPYTQIFIGME
jgi:hypothetical protein